jgi:hypothetical protein
MLAFISAIMIFCIAFKAAIPALNGLILTLGIVA